MWKKNFSFFVRKRERERETNFLPSSLKKLLRSNIPRILKLIIPGTPEYQNETEKNPSLFKDFIIYLIYLKRNYSDTLIKLMVQLQFVWNDISLTIHTCTETLTRMVNENIVIFGHVNEKHKNIRGNSGLILAPLSDTWILTHTRCLEVSRRRPTLWTTEFSRNDIGRHRTINRTVIYLVASAMGWLVF